MQLLLYLYYSQRMVLFYRYFDERFRQFCRQLLFRGHIFEGLEIKDTFFRIEFQVLAQYALYLFFEWSKMAEVIWSKNEGLHTFTASCGYLTHPNIYQEI